MIASLYNQLAYYRWITHWITPVFYRYGLVKDWNIEAPDAGRALKFVISHDYPAEVVDAVREQLYQELCEAVRKGTSDYPGDDHILLELVKQCRCAGG